MYSDLKRIVSHPELAGPALRAFTDYPALEKVTVQFLHFVPPWVLYGTVSVAESSIRNALLAYESEQSGHHSSGHRRYIEAIAASAKLLSAIRVSVKNSNDQWEIWNYDQPLTEYMQQRKRSAIQIRNRENPIALGPVLIKLLASISPTNELVTADLDITSLFAGGTHQ